MKKPISTRLSIVAASLLMFTFSAYAQPPGGGGGPDFSAIAETLGVSEEALVEALGSPPPDFAAAAEKLGISEEALVEAMPEPPAGADVQSKKRKQNRQGRRQKTKKY